MLLIATSREELLIAQDTLIFLLQNFYGFYSTLKSCIENDIDFSFLH